MQRFAMDAQSESGQDAWAVERPSSIGAWVRHEDAQAEITRLQVEVEQLRAESEGAMMIIAQERAENLNLKARVAELEAALAAQVVETVKPLVAALSFYADVSAWNQPPVRTVDGLFSVEYENQASKMQRDRGRIAREALSALTTAQKECGA